MLKNFIFILFFVVVSFNGCGGDKIKSDPKQVALKMCEYSKKGEIEKMKEYVAVKHHQELEAWKTLINVGLQNEATKDLYEKQMKSFANIDCEKTNIISNIDEKTKQVSNKSTVQNYFLKNEKNEWIVYFKN